MNARRLLGIASLMALLVAVIVVGTWLPVLGVTLESAWLCQRPPPTSWHFWSFGCDGLMDHSAVGSAFLGVLVMAWMSYRMLGRLVGALSRRS